MKKRREGFTLLEIIISVAVLAIVGMLVVQLFAGADNIVKKAADLDRAALEAQSALELCRLCRDSEDIFALLYGEKGGGLSGDGGSYIIYYDKDWQTAEKPLDGGYTLKMVISLPGSGGSLGVGRRDLTVTVTKNSSRASALEVLGEEAEIFTVKSVMY